MCKETCLFASTIRLVSKKINYLPRKYDFSFGNIIYSKKDNYLLRKYDFSSRNAIVPRTLINGFETMIFSFEYTSDSEKVNSSLRKYDLFIQKYDLCGKNSVPGVSTRPGSPQALELGEPIAGKPREAWGPINPLQARRRPGRVSICCVFPIS